MPSNALPVLPLPLQQRVVDVRDLLTVPWAMFLRLILGAMAIPTYAQGTHEERVGKPSDPEPKGMPASGFRSGAFFWETDRTVLYQAQAVPDDPADPESPTHMEWVYVAGTMRGNLANKPTDLVDLSAPLPLPKDRLGNDTGFLFHGTDYAHTWRWTGSAWEYAPGDRVAGEIAWFTADPGTGWALCDGAATTRTTPAAGTAAFTTPNLIGAYAKGGSVYTGSITGASGSVSGTTGIEAAHTHAVDAFTGLPSEGKGFTAGTVGASVDTHYHAIHTTTAAGSAHSHSIDALELSGVDPAHVDLLPYFRR